MKPIEFWTGDETLSQTRAGSVRVESVARACLARIAARENVVHAWSYLNEDAVVACARALDTRVVRGPLHGLPIGIKDIMLTHDMPTQFNSTMYRDFHPRIDASSVSILRSTGALVFGKTATVEFGSTGHAPATVNPHAAAHTPGGSSSGSAAAVADCHVPVALGTQTGGSIMRPASYCGVYAIKPTWGLVGNEGAKAFAPSLDTIGWFARCAGDLRILLDVLDPRAFAPDYAPSVRRRIAVCKTPYWSAASAATQHALEQAHVLLERADFEVVMLELPASFADLLNQHDIIMRAEGRTAFLPQYLLAQGQLHPDIRGQVENVARFSHAQLTDAYNEAARCREMFDAIASPFDGVLTPSTVDEAPLGLSGTGPLTFNAMWTLLHAPCINIPGFSGQRRLPLGLTLTGPRFSDRRLLYLAHQIGEVFARGQ